MCFFFFLFVFPVSGQQQLDEVIPFDPAVTTGTLPNGLKYYVRHNGRPEKRVAMRLVVKAGSLDEADDQQGLAHMLEHMAFNGTTHFKPGELVSYFESTGTRLGPHVNAYTSFGETVYMLQLPTDKPEIVAKGFTALSDYAGGMTLNPKEIDKERGVVLEEWRLGLGAQSRIRDKQIPVLYYHSRYAERLPIGKPEVLKSFKPERLRAFYKTFYRPDRMAVVVVGDLDVAAVEKSIREAFGGLKNPSTPLPPRKDDVPLHTEELVNVATDAEAQRSSVTIIRKRPADPDGRVRDYRRDLVRQLISQMINDRFEELAQKPDAKFLGAGAFGDSLSPKVDTFDLAASVPDGGIERGMVAVATEAERVRQFGFSATELERVKKSVLPQYERAYAERDKTESASFADEYVRNFLNGEPSPGIAYELELVKTYVPTISLEEVNTMAKSLLAEGSTVVLAVSPQKPNITIPAADQLVADLKKTETAPVTAWTETATRQELLQQKPTPGTVASRREIPELGVTVVTFSNGVEAWLKPTDFKNDQVLFTMYARGGTSLASPERFVEASFSSGFAMLSGVAGLKATDLPKILAGKLANASPFMSLSTHGIGGSSTPGDLETALQLLYAEFTQPGDDPDAFAMMKRQLDAAVVNRQQNPGAVFGQRVAQINSSNHYTTQPLTTERVAALDQSAMTSFYKERFTNAADFTLFMVGNIKVEEVLPLLAQYVGGLPSTGKAASEFKDVGIKFPASVVRETVKKGTEPKTQTVITFDAEPPVDELEAVKLNAAVDVLEIALRDILREQLGQTYTVSADYTDARPQEGTGRVMITFGAAPENAAAMTDRVLQEIKRMQSEPASADYVNRSKETSRRGLETSQKQNQYWLGALQSKHLMRRDPLLILKAGERIDVVTPATVQEMFKKYFNFDRYTVVTLVPEK
ncbi:MAG: M16 family metallopeptidase [Acidobacteriota bacterium]